jgi:nifR3 family TIM-barrel protein
MKQLKIGDLKLKNPLLLAPMVEVTNLPYRVLCKKAGAALTYTEMTYIDAILHKNKKTQDMLKTVKEDKPVGLQVTGDDETEFSKILPIIKKYSLVDINAGCPSIKITGNKAGAYLLNSPNKIVSMVKTLKKQDKPVTVKIRLGFNKNKGLEIAKMIEKAGADALTVHGRLAIQSNSTPADWTQIEKIKKNLGIPVIGNGDISSPESAAKMLDIADGAMIGRAAIGDPLIFKRILYYLKTGKEQDKEQNQIKQLNFYLKLYKKYKLEEISKIKYTGTNFLKGMQGAGELRNEFMQLHTLSEMQEFVKNL